MQLQAVVYYVIQAVLLAVVVVSMIMSVRYSIQSRHGAENAERNRHVHGKLNMAMGAMMLGIAGIQLSQPVISTPRYIFIAICVLLGGYNFYAGYKNWKESGGNQKSAKG